MPGGHGELERPGVEADVDGRGLAELVAVSCTGVAAPAAIWMPVPRAYRMELSRVRSRRIRRPARNRRSTLLSHATRRHTASQPNAVLGWKIAMSSCPSATDASGISSSPAGSEPQFANSTLCTCARCIRWPATWYMIENGFAFTSERAAPSTYATQPTFFFQVATGVGDHRGIQTHAAHHDERTLLALAVETNHHREPDVDRLHVALEGRCDHRVGIGEWKLQVAGEQVARAARHDRQGHLGARHRLAHRADRAVAARDQHRVGSRRDRLARQSVAEFVDGRLEEEGLTPSRISRVPSHRIAQLVDLDLDRVVDERRATAANRRRKGRQRQRGPCG